MISLRWKILLVSLLTVFIPIYLLNRYAINFFDHFTRTQLESHIRKYALLVGEQYKQSHGDPSATGRAAFQSYLARAAAELEARIQIVSTNGVVLYDSDGGMDIGKNLIALPEIAEDVTGRYSARSRLTPDRRYMYYHIARPVKDENHRTLAVVYTVRHTSPIIRAIKQMMRNQRIATWLALGAAAATAFVLSLTLTRRLRALSRAAKRFAEGTAVLDTSVRGRDEIAELEKAIRKMATEIASRSEYNRDFICTTLHELKTPITAIRGAAEILRDGGARNEAACAKFTGNILDQTERLLRLVGELRELTAIDSESRREQGENREYVEFVRTTLQKLEETYPESHAALEVELPAGPIPVRIIPHRIEQVFSNLLENAFRYTPVTGRVTVRVSAPHGGRVVTTVADTGCGIQPSDLPHVFERFFTTEPRDARKSFGSGLGLAIAQSVIRNHNGRIWAESEPGKGARFHFELPLAQ